MYFIKLIFNEIFYRPLLNGLVFFTSVLPGHDLGLAVILLTLIIKIITFPLTHKMLHTQKKMKAIEPEIKKIYAENHSKEKQAQALMEIYRAHGVSPFSGFLALLIQMPLLIALYRVFWKGIPFSGFELYPFIAMPETVNTLFLGFIQLMEPSIGLAAVSAVSQYFQAKLALPPGGGDSRSKSGSGDNTQRVLQFQMTYFFPILVFFIAFKLPAAVSLYWTAMNVFAIIHEAAVRRQTASDGKQ